MMSDLRDKLAAKLYDIKVIWDGGILWKDLTTMTSEQVRELLFVKDIEVEYGYDLADAALAVFNAHSDKALEERDE